MKAPTRPSRGHSRKNSPLPSPPAGAFASAARPRRGLEAPAPSGSLDPEGAVDLDFGIDDVPVCLADFCRETNRDVERTRRLVRDKTVRGMVAPAMIFAAERHAAAIGRGHVGSNTPQGSIEALERERIAKADLAELKVRERAGQLLDRESMIAFATETVNGFRLALETLPSDIAGKLAGLSASRIETVLAEEVERRLRDIARLMEPDQ